MIRAWATLITAAPKSPHSHDIIKKVASYAEQAVIGVETRFAQQMMADTSTITFFFVLAATFVAVRWFLFSESAAAPSSSATGPQSTTRPQTQRGPRRTVTPGMIEVVQALAPSLTVDQIRYDLERTGDIEATVERYLTSGTLPFPPHSRPVSQPASRPGTAASTSSSSPSTVDLITKYELNHHVKSTDDILSKPAEKIKWSNSKEERQQQLRRQQQEMILRARRKLELKMTEQAP
jgi:coupling of ubiquitin conjugation to ER degradation protein 1